MDGFTIEPAAQGIYPAVCHLGDVYVPLTEEALDRLRSATTATPEEFYRLFVDAVGASAYLKEQVAQLWAKGDPAEQTRRLQQAIAKLPG